MRDLLVTRVALGTVLSFTIIALLTIGVRSAGAQDRTDLRRPPEERQPPLAAGRPMTPGGSSPELDLGSVGSALTLLAGAYYLMTSSRRHTE
jgi:hypothetical protein